MSERREAQADDASSRAAPGEEPRSEPREGAGDVLRRVFYTGLGALFATEEGIRKAAGDLPKEVVNRLLAQAQAGKDEALRVVAVETRRFLENVDLAGVTRDLLSGLTLEIKTEIRFHPRDDAAAGGPRVRPSVSVRRGGAGEQGKG